MTLWSDYSAGEADRRHPPRICRTPSEDLKSGLHVAGQGRWPGAMAAEDCHLVVQHDDLDGERLSLRQLSRIDWRVRQNARERIERVTAHSAS